MAVILEELTFWILFFPAMTTLSELMADRGPSRVSMRLLYRSRNMRQGRFARLLILLIRLFW